MKVSLCITHFNRFEMVVKSFEQVLNDDRIGEVIISDDKSTDASFDLLISFFQHIPKVRLLQNMVNVGMSVNKERAISYSNFRSAIIFDSDNILTPSYLDALEKVHHFKNNTIYLPVGALPNFDYSAYSGFLINSGNVANYMGESMFRCALNTCNCLVNVNYYLDVFEEDKNIGCADTINHIYNHLRSGGELFFVPNLVYDHLVHPSSGFLENMDYNMKKAKEIENKILSL